MKKLRFVVPTMVLAVAMMGAGYAAWSNQLTISNTVNTATFDFAFTADSAQTISLVNSTVDTQHVIDKAVTLGTDNKSATINLTNLYPGINAEFDLTIDNTSSIPATLTGVTLANAAGLPIVMTITDITAEPNTTLSEGSVVGKEHDVKIHYSITVPDDVDGDLIDKGIVETISPTFTQATPI